MYKSIKYALTVTAAFIISSGTALASTQYTVVSGDSLWKISQNYNVSIDIIKSLNSLTSDSIYSGQKLVIPYTSQSFTTYTVVSGDTLSKISLKFNCTISEIKILNTLSSDVIYIGQNLKVPQTLETQGNTSTTYKVVSGDTLWIISKKFDVTVADLKSENNLVSDTISIGQSLRIPSKSGTEIIPDTQSTPPPTEDNSPQTTSINYINYTVKQGDNLWSIAQVYRIPYQELLTANSLNQSSLLQIGQVLRIPVHIVPVKATPGSQYGELLDWWTEAQYVFYTGATAKVTDFYTGKTFFIKRTTGANHADCETLTAEDTNIMKEIWNNSWNWTNRPVIIEVEGRRLAASMSGMPHAGLDSYPSLANIYNRSGNFGYGPNFDYIKANTMDGHFDVHFLNSTKHVDGVIDENHQAKIQIAAGK